MRLLAAGAPIKAYIDMCVKYRCAKLYSALTERKAIDAWDDALPLMVDSGAHSWNKTTITKVHAHRVSSKLPPIKTHANSYLEWIFARRQRSVTWVELDCYGVLDRDYVDGMYRDVMAFGLAGDFIRVYHPVLDGGTLRTLEEWIDEGQTYIGIGNDSTHLLPAIFARTRDRVKLHGFAMTKPEVLKRYPFFSADSTTPLATMMYGSLFDGDSFKQIGVHKLIKERSPHKLSQPVERLDMALRDFKKSERYLTDLWRHKGVDWGD